MCSCNFINFYDSFSDTCNIFLSKFCVNIYSFNAFKKPHTRVRIAR